MTLQTSLIQRFIALFFFVFVVASLLRPWRASVSQDDASYAAQAIHFAQGDFRLHPDSIAALLPQTVLGAVAIHLFPQQPLVILNGMTFLIFVALMVFLFQQNQWSLPVFVTFFSNPYWFQYGVSYLYDVYAIVLLFLLFLVVERHAVRKTFLSGVVVVFLSFLLVTQLQTFLVIPLAWVVILRKQWKQAWPLMMGAALGLMVYFKNRNMSHLAVPAFVISHHQDALDIFFTFVQLVSALGLFLLPFGRLIHKKQLIFGAVSFVVLFLCLYFLPVHILSGGVLFTDYLPRFVGVCVASLGVLGFVFTFHRLKYQTLRTDWPLLGAGAIIFMAFSIRGSADLRYAMIAIPLLFHFYQCNQQHCFGNSKILASGLFFLSIFLNSYQLDTTEIRWNLADRLVKQGIPRNKISAGYGHDYYFFEWDCVDKKLKQFGVVNYSSHEFQEEVYRYIPRLYEKNWKPAFLIKPYSVFGKKVKLVMHRKEGQDKEPLQFVEYKNFGLKSAIVVISTGVDQPAECF